MSEMIDRIRNRIFLLVVVIFTIIMLVGNALALGITPGRTTINFEPNLKREVPFSLLNNEHKNMQIIFLVQGELNKSITLFTGDDEKLKDKKEKNIVEFTPEQDSKGFRYGVNLPEKLEPGLHSAEIIALEIPQISEEGTFVGATVAVATQLYVYVPYPGKYIDFDMNVLNHEQGSTATFVVPVVSRGKLGIGEVRAVIDIYTALNERIATIETDHNSLAPGGRTELSAQWIVDANSGNYIAKVTVFYDGESRSMEKQFSIGESALNIESILVNEFTLGEIAKLQILVENKWNQELKGVFANLLVYNSEDQIMADVKSSAEDIPPLSRKELLAYWDTVGVEEGEYDGKLMVKYGEKSADKNLLLKISADSLDITGVGYAIRGKRGGEGVTLTTILLVLVIILLVVNLAWFVFFRRFVGKKK